MAKKTAAKKLVTKKPRRRLKRTARRSLAAVLMITAVVVAAIPVPENAAAPEGGISALDDPALPEPSAYSYPENAMKSEHLCRDSKLDPDAAGHTTTYEAKIVTQLSDDEYQMAWQFKFYMETVEGYERGIISQYNGTYQQDEVTLNPNVIYEYDVIGEDKFNDFYLENPTDPSFAGRVYTYTLNKPDSAALEDPQINADQFFNEYFSALYQEQIAAYEQYEKDHDAWARDPNADPGAEPQKPARLERKISDLSDDQRLKYYCDVNRTKAGSLAGCKLASVIDSGQRDPNGANVRVYIPQKLSGETPSGHFDSLGLRYVSDASIIGIGDKAFYNIENVNKLIIPREIRYIGQSAFEHSFIKEVAFYNVKDVGDRAFKDCTQLTKIDFGTAPTTVNLGVECFYGTALTEVVFPTTIARIGPGAFAYCGLIQKLDFSKITARPAVIDAYAFYNTRGLNEVNFIREGASGETVNINTIGAGAFAVHDGETGNLTEFVFPSTISQPRDDSALGGTTGMGDCILAGRTNLKKVVMPADFGRSSSAKVPDNLLYNCYNLECLQFPADGNGSCGYATYTPGERKEDGTWRTPGLFSSISNPDFYVQGPEVDRTQSQATPRKQTWDAKTAVSDVVPYLYVRNGLNYYEISDGDYLMCVNDQGVLTSCTRKDPSATLTDVDLKIPAKVGDTDVTGIATDCFTDPGLNNNVKTLKIEDDSLIATINASAFRGWEKLRKVYIGNSVTQIGDNAFEGCNKLIDVTFSSPKNGHEAFKIGADAFKTGSEELTFHGDIVKGYAPFEWAMDKGNIIKQPEGIRVCYQSLLPTLLTVMYDDNADLVTLVDYPKMSQISSVLNEAYADEIKDGAYGTYEHMREARSYAEYAGAAFDSRREAFKTEWITDGEEAYDSENYGPWITPDYIAGETWTGGTVTSAPSTGGGTTGRAIADFFFEPITAYAAGTPEPYYTKYPFTVGSSDSAYPQLTAEEIGLLDAVQNIVVPDGVDSIDVYGYYTNSDHNRNNASIYLERKLDSDVWRMYTSKVRQDANGSTATQPGLFSGYYDDKLSSTNGEQYKRGNDYITSVTLNSVTYLPDYAFDSCENLLEVNLGPVCSDIGTAPFRGCYEMERVGDNEWYTTTNGIIYSKNEDGSLTIEECLSARGRKSAVGPAIVSGAGDENLKNVSKIKEGAFDDCDSLTAVDFGSNGTAGLTVIPEDCFRNCDNLQNVVLPITVNDIGRGAFVGANSLRDLTIYGGEVKISGSAFDEEKPVQTTVRAYEDSAVVRYVKEYGDVYKLYYDAEHPLGRQWQVSFYDANYKLIENLTDDLGNPLDNPQYVTDGERVTIPEAPVLEGWTFEDWVGLDGATIRDTIRGDVIFYAQGHFDSGAPVDGKWVVEFLDGVDGQQLAGRGSNPSDGKYYVEAGKSFADMGWAEPLHPVHEGFEEAGFSSGNGTSGAWTAQTVVNGNLTIVALYKATANGGTNNPSGGSTNTSGGTTSGGTTSGGTTSNRNSSSRNSSSSNSSSGSSTSTTSTTSGAGMYTVFVENGYGSGSYAPGTMVIVTAAQPAAGMRFDKWTTDSNGVTLVSVSLPATTFVMPSNNVSVKANFVADTTPQRAAAPSGGSSGNTNTNDNGNSGNTRVDIEKPGISNRDLATANVNGSTDNFVIKISETDEATRAVSAALTNKYGTLDNILYYAMDITLWDSTGTYQLTGDQLNGISVDITIPIPDSLVAYGGNNMAGAVVNGDQLESLNENFTTINGIPCIRFRATHFSPYTVYVDTGNLVEGMLDTTPKTGDPIHPKWFLSLGLACLSMILFLKRDKRKPVK